MEELVEEVAEEVVEEMVEEVMEWVLEEVRYDMWCRRKGNCESRRRW